MGLPLENDLLAITSAQIMELNQNLAHIKNLSSLNNKCCVNESRDMSRENFSKNRK